MVCTMDIACPNVNSIREVFLVDLLGGIMTTTQLVESDLYKEYRTRLENSPINGIGTYDINARKAGATKILSELKVKGFICGNGERGWRITSTGRSEIRKIVGSSL